MVGGPLLIPGGGIENGPVLAVISHSGRRPVTCVNAESGSGGVGVRRECAGKFGFPRPCWPDSRSADLRVVRRWGYAIAVEANTIAIEQLWCQSCPSRISPLQGLLAQFRGWAVPLGEPARLV